MAITYIPFKPKGSDALYTADFLKFYAKYPTGITLYQCTAEDNRVDKVAYLTEVLNIDGTFRQECDVLRPSVIIEIDSLPQFNYVHVAEFNRYYFVRSFSAVQKKLWKIELECDVLYTYRNQIRSASAFVDRNEFTYNKLLRDNLMPFESEPTYTVLKDTEHSPYNVGDIEPSLHPGTGELIYHDRAWRYVINGVVDQDEVYEKPRTNMCINFASNNLAILDSWFIYAAMLDFAQKSASDVWRLWSGDPSKSINNIMIYPFDVKDALHIGEDDYKTLCLGESQITQPIELETGGSVVKAYIARENAADYARMYIGSIDLRAYGKTWYELDSTVKMYYPFLGYKELDAKIVMGKWVNIYVLVDYNDGTGTYYTYVDDEFTGRGTLVSLDTCRLGIQLPLGYDQSQGQGLKAAITSIPAAAGAAKTGNVFGVVASALDMAQAVAPKMTISGTYSGSAWTASEGPMHIECHIITPTPVPNSEYGTEYGYPLAEKVSLDALTGFTKVGEIHLEGLGTATSEEKTTIVNLLKSGVIF